MGFDVRPSHGDTVTVTLNNSSLIFTESDLWEDAGPGSLTVYIAVTDIDRYFDSVKDKAEVVWPLQEMAYGSREFGVRDCNGYLLAFQAKADDVMRGVTKQLVVEDSELAGSSF